MASSWYFWVPFAFDTLPCCTSSRCATVAALTSADVAEAMALAASRICSSKLRSWLASRGRSRGLSSASFRAAASIAAAADRSSFSAITLGSSGSTQSPLSDLATSTIDDTADATFLLVSVTSCFFAAAVLLSPCSVWYTAWRSAFCWRAASRAVSCTRWRWSDVTSAPAAAPFAICSRSTIALRAMLAAETISSCLLLVPAATTLAVDMVTAFVMLTSSSGVAARFGGSDDSSALTSCTMPSIADSMARAPRAASSSTDLTTLRSCEMPATSVRALSLRTSIDGSLTGWPDADLLALSRSLSAAATSLIAFRRSSCALMSFDVMAVAPSLHASARRVMASTAPFAAVASCSCEPAAPAATFLVQSTSCLAILRISSLWALNVSFGSSGLSVPADANMAIVSRSPRRLVTAAIAVSQACTPLALARTAAMTFATRSDTTRASSDSCFLAAWFSGLACTVAHVCASCEHAGPRSRTVVSTDVRTSWLSVSARMPRLARAISEYECATSRALRSSSSGCVRLRATALAAVRLSAFASSTISSCSCLNDLAVDASEEPTDAVAFWISERIVVVTSPSDLDVSSVWRRSFTPSCMSLTASSTLACAPVALPLPPDSFEAYMSCIADSVIVLTMSKSDSALAFSSVREAAPIAELTNGTN
eukprot:Opistho-1_new@27201